MPFSVQNHPSHNNIFITYLHVKEATSQSVQALFLQHDAKESLHVDLQRKKQFRKMNKTTTIMRALY